MLLTGCCDITKIRNDLKMRNSSWIVYIYRIHRTEARFKKSKLRNETRETISRLDSIYLSTQLTSDTRRDLLFAFVRG